MTIRTSTAPMGPIATSDEVTFRFADPDGHLQGVRLAQQVRIPGDQLDFTRTEGGWELRLPRPPVWRLEYRLELEHADGGREEICDPANPLRAPGAFGDKSVLEFADYQRPGWLDAPAGPGASTEIRVPSRYLHAEVYVRLWAPADAGPTERLPLLVAHDGPEYDELSSLTTYAAAMIEAGRLPRHRIALLGPGEGDEWYTASVSYARALALAVVPTIRRRVAVTGPVVAMGASLGGLAALHAQRRHPGLFGGLFLQSGSFFDRRLDPQERGFGRYGRITRFVADTRRGTLKAEPVPATLTCGELEENLGNNRDMATTLHQQGYRVGFVELPDVHNYVAWRDAFDPHLTGLLVEVWGPGDS
ncbi:MAG TPA: alpha/beta hydrolase-fold protein [Mycobacteriales bacterium]|nr:alpha/beta hydrolase-fold protein [Mycobacteriales bacterium]